MKTKKPPTRLKKGLMAGALSVAVLALSGCIKVEAEYEFLEDNTAAFTMIATDIMDNQLFVSENECASFVQEMTLDEIIADAENVPENHPPVDRKHEFFTDDEGRNGCRMKLSNIPVPVLENEDEGREAGFRRVGNEYLVSFTESYDDFSTDPALEGMGIPSAEVFFQVTFPGEVTDHTAGELANDGRTVVFEDFVESTKEPIEIRASAIPSASGSSLTSIITIAIGAVLVLGVVLGGLFLIKRNRNDDDDDEDDEYEDDEYEDDGYDDQQYPQPGYQQSYEQNYGEQDYAQQQYPTQQYTAMNQQQYTPTGYPVPPPPSAFQQPQYEPQEDEQYSQGQQYPPQPYEEQYPQYEEEEDDFLPPPPPPPAAPPAPVQQSVRAPLPAPRTQQPAPAPTPAPRRSSAPSQGLPKPSGGLPGAPASRPNSNGQGGAQPGAPKKLPPLPPPPPRFKQ